MAHIRQNILVLQGEHSAILSTFITLPFVIKIFVLSTFEWPLKTGLTVCYNNFIDHKLKLGPTTGPHSAVGNVSGNRCKSDCRSRGRKFDSARTNTFMEIDHEIISTVILLPPPFCLIIQ